MQRVGVVRGQHFNLLGRYAASLLHHRKLSFESNDQLALAPPFLDSTLWTKHAQSFLLDAGRRRQGESLSTWAHQDCIRITQSI